jgi:hypothetical protein
MGTLSSMDTVGLETETGQAEQGQWELNVNLSRTQRQDKQVWGVWGVLKPLALKLLTEAYV